MKRLSWFIAGLLGLAFVSAGFFLLLRHPGCGRARYRSPDSVANPARMPGRNGNVASSSEERADTVPATLAGSHVRKARSVLIEGAASQFFDYDRGLKPLAVSWPLPREHQTALMKGAEAKLTLRIVDSTGRPVPEADVDSLFLMGDVKGTKVRARSDGDGLAVIHSKTTDEITILTEKEGYYSTYWRHRLSVPGYDCVENGRWLPWNPVLEVVLKEIRDPLSLDKRTASLTFPADLEVGFDFSENDLVSPHGKGMTSDCIITVDGVAKENREFHYTTHLAFSEGKGLIVLPPDTFSILQSAYSAPNVGYSQEMVFAYDYDGTHKGSGDSFRRNEILYFKIGGHDRRPTRYGKIVGGVVGGLAYPDTNTASIGFSYYLNPKDGDPNLEFEPSDEFIQILERHVHENRQR